MGFLASLRKSWKLQKLQRMIHPPREKVDEIVDEFFSSLDVETRRDKALDDFWELCVSDDDIQRIMLNYQIKRRDLENLYGELMGLGLGIWVKGHFLALSTLAYSEPFWFYVESRKRGDSDSSIMPALLDYWEGRSPQGSPINDLRMSENH